jgi:uncharacterized protein (UPF0212 family)
MMYVILSDLSAVALAKAEAKNLPCAGQMVRLWLTMTIIQYQSQKYARKITKVSGHTCG